MKVEIMQELLSFRDPKFYEEQGMSIEIPKDDLLKLINNAEDNELITLRKQNIYIDEKLNNPQPINDEDN